MSHNILLLFLSDVKATSDRKKLLPPVPYQGLGRTMTTNESAVRYLAQKNEVNADTIQIEKIFAFATDKVRKQYVGQNYAGDTVRAKDAVDQEGKPLTHLAYFKYRLQSEKIIEDIESCMPEDDEEKGIVGTVCPFDDTSNDVKENMKTIVGMANRIQTYIQTLPETEQNDVFLHADMTGGFRHASMMMLAVMRLMQYQGVKIGHVVYSNFNKSSGTGTVQEVSEIYHMFDLIAGAEEFATFGSVKTIQSFFDNRPKTPALVNLIQAMGKFADAIKLSRRKDFETALDDLNLSMHGFIRNGNSNELTDALMGLMQKRFERDYSKVLQNAKDALAPIEWCLEHDYLQQALTLYTESIPEYLFSSGILNVDPEVFKHIEETKPKDDKRDTLFYLFTSYTPERKLLRGEGWDPAAVKLIIKATHNVLAAINQRDELAESNAKTEFNKIMLDNLVAEKETSSFIQVFEALKQIRHNPKDLLNVESMDLSLTVPLQNILKFFEAELKKDMYGSKRVDKIFSGLLNIKSNRDNKFYDLFLFDYKKTDIKEKFPKCKGLYNLFYQGIIKANANLDQEEVYKAMQTYFEVKAIRNDSAHAKLSPQGQEMSAEELTNYMEEGLRHLRNLKLKVVR